MAEGASEQAASLEQMATMTRRNTETAEKVKQLAAATRGAGDAGTTNMQAMAEVLTLVGDSIADAAEPASQRLTSTAQPVAAENTRTAIGAGRAPKSAKVAF
jgi:methyl-accepting chemotaxis protein